MCSPLEVTLKMDNMKEGVFICFQERVLPRYFFFYMHWAFTIESNGFLPLTTSRAGLEAKASWDSKLEAVTWHSHKPSSNLMSMARMLRLQSPVPGRAAHSYFPLCSPIGWKIMIIFISFQNVHRHEFRAIWSNEVTFITLLLCHQSFRRKERTANWLAATTIVSSSSKMA